MIRYVETVWDALEWKPPIDFGGFCYFGNAYSLNVIVWLSHSFSFILIPIACFISIFVDFMLPAAIKINCKKNTLISLEKNKHAD